MKHVHIAFQDELLEALTDAAREEKSSRSEIVRAAVASFLRARERRRKAEAMRRYAESMASHSGEITASFESAAAERLLRETDW